METHLPPQPPPDAPAPPPGPEAIRSRRKMSAILWVGGVCMGIALLVLVALPMILKQSVAVDRTRAIGNLKQMHLALMDFDSDYGRFPDATTIASVKAATHTTLPLGTTTSNDFFRQLVATTAKTEVIFWAKTATTPRKPDGNITGAHALEKGECSYAYVAGLSTSGDSSAPIAMAPMISGTSNFDPKPYGDKAVMLRVDGWAKVENIDPRGEVEIGGKNLFDPSQPYWGGKTPDIKWPE